MTARLLNRSGQPPAKHGIRDALVTASLSPALQTDEFTISVAALPLFRTGDAGLDQVVRVAVEPASAQVDRIALHGPSGLVVESRGAADLLVPEVTEPQTWRLSATVAGVERAGEVTLLPQRKFTVHLVHHSHLDIGYTDPQGIVLRNHLEYLDAAVELGRQHRESDPNTRFSWTVESNFPVRAWLEQRPATVVDEFCRLAVEDVIEVTAMPFNLHTEAASMEELARLLRTAVTLRRRYGIPVRSAMHTDVPGATVGWVDALYEAGIRYLSAAHNWAGRSVPYLVGGDALTRPFWWRTPAGARLLTWFTDSPHGLAYMEGNLLGLADSYEDAVDRLPLYLHALANRPIPYTDAIFGLAGIPDDLEARKAPYPYDLLHLRVQGAHSDNACPSVRPAEIAREWNERWAYPELVTSTNTGFFTRAERLLGDRLAEFTGDWGDWWADGLGSGARPTGYNRRTQSLARTAETVHLLADLEAGERASVRQRLDSIYDHVGLFDEHTWGAANPWHDHETGPGSGALQWARKAEFAHRAHDDARDLLHAGLRRLGATHRAAQDALASVLVYNTTGQVRTDIVTAFLPESITRAIGSALVAVDGRKQEEVPTRVASEQPRRASPRGRVIEFIAREVPPLGWVRFDVVATTEQPEIATLIPPVRVRNEFFEVAYDLEEAVISSIVDRQNGRELVNAEALPGFNEYIYDSYGTAAHVNHLSSRIEARDLSLLTSRAVARNAVVLRAESDAVGQVLEIEAHPPGVDWLRTTVTLPAGVPRIDITNRIAKRPSTTKESIYFAFPFTGSSRPAGYELTGSVEGHDVPQLPGAPQHMRAIRHWVGLHDDGYTTAWATLEAPLVQFGTIHLPYQPFPSTIALEHPEPGTIYSWAVNNIWDTNFPAQQQGEMTFRYAVSGSVTDGPRVHGRATAAGLTDPLVAAVATARGGARTAPASGSLLAIDRADVVVTSMGRPLDGSPGVVVRLRSLAPTDVETTLTLDALAVSTAHLAGLLEEDPRTVAIGDGRVTVPIPAGATRSLLLRP